MDIIFPLVILYFSYKQPARYIREPTKKNMIWCIILGAINAIYVYLGIREFGGNELGIAFELFVIAVTVLHGWIAYRNFMAIKGVFFPREGVIEPSDYQENRYCGECGEKLSGSDLFCGSCGTKIEGGANYPFSVTNNDLIDPILTKSREKGPAYWVTPGSAFLVILIMLQKWIHLRVLDSLNEFYSLFGGPSQRLETKYSLFQFSTILNNINRYVSSDDIKIIAIVFKVAAMSVIILQALLIYNYVKGSNKTRGMARLATVITCLVSILFIIIVYAVNSSIAEETYGIVNTSIKSTAMPYLAMLFSVIGRIGLSSTREIINESVAEVASSEIKDN